MKNNTTSNDTCYTIQPLTTCIDIKTERRLIASWHTSGLTDTQIRKMLMLYFGEPAWMNQQKLYDSYRFSEIATGLKFRSKEDFLDILLKCTGFGRIWKNEKDSRLFRGKFLCINGAVKAEHLLQFRVQKRIEARKHRGHDRGHGLLRTVECSTRKPSGFVVRW